MPVYYLLVSIVIGLFLAMLFLNIYFRVKVLKVYKVLVQNRVDFKTMDILNKDKIEKEVIPRYPKFANEIRTFSAYIKNSVQMATVLIVLITLFGAILMWYRG